MPSDPSHSVSGPKKAWLALRFWKPRNGDAAARRRIVTAKGLDVDSLEEMVNRRMRLVLRHTWLVVTFATLLIIGLVAVTIYLTATPTILKIAVGPRSSEDVMLVEKLADKLRRERAPFRLEPLIMDGPVTIKEMSRKPQYDLAVVSSSPDMSPDWPVVAILHQNVMVLMVPAPGLRTARTAKTANTAKTATTTKTTKTATTTKTAKTAKAVKIEKISDLAGHRVGIVARSEATPELLRIVLEHYKVPPEKVQTVIVEPDNLKTAIQEGQIDVVLAAGPVTGHVIAQAVAAASTDKKGPTIIPIDQAEAIAKRIPAYDSDDIVAGAFGGSPPSPPDSVTTLSFPQYLVARKTLSDTKIAAFSKLLYTSRQALAHELPGVAKIESPSTDKDSTVLVHPGTEAYLGDNQKSFFDKYGDDIFYGMLIIPFFGSAIAAVAGYFRADSSTRRIRLLHRLLQLMKRGRSADSVEALDQLQSETDSILASTIQQAERNQIDEMGLMLFTMVIEQAHNAIAERRAVVLSHPAGQPHQSNDPPLADAAEAAE
jgi:TRAP-type uncharacterized transport system substrate-binding protein